MRLEDTAAIVTGAAAGFGWEFTDAFVAEGASVLAVDWAADRLADAVARVDGPGEVASHVADVGDEDDVAAMVDAAREAFGRVDLLVNNAGVKQLTLGEPEHRVQDIPTDLWDRVTRTNLRGTFLCARQVLPEMLDRGSGRLLHLSSGHGKSGRVGRAPYVATKHGIEGFQKSLALELEGTGVDSLAFTPPGGGVATREAEFVEDPSSFSHDSPVVREPVVRLAAGEGRNGGRYQGDPDGESVHETDYALED